MSKRIIYLDASAFKESLCLKRLEYITVVGYRDIFTSPALSYGTATHKYISALRTTTKHEIGIHDASKYFLPIAATYNDKEWRNLMHLFKTCAAYHQEVYMNDRLEAIKIKEGGNFLIEQKFSIPVYEDNDFIVMLSGTIDEIGMLDGEFIICDRKTSSAYFAPEAALEVYRASTQLMFYKYIAQKILKIPNIRCYIEGIFISSAQKTKFIHSDIFDYDDVTMSRFEQMLNDCVANIIHCHKTQSWPKNFLCCDSSKFDVDKVGKCRFFNLCVNDRDADIFKFMEEKQFIKRPYNPLLFDVEHEGDKAK